MPTSQTTPHRSKSRTKAHVALPVTTLDGMVTRILSEGAASQATPGAFNTTLNRMRNVLANLQTKTIRLRSGKGIDRRLKVQYLADPQDPQAVFMRVHLASEAPLRAPVQEVRMLTTQQAADRLNVSRPHIIKLIADGVFGKVEIRGSGHRRIAETEVERVAAAQQASRRQALGALMNDKATAHLRQKQLDAALNKTKARWTRPAS